MRDWIEQFGGLKKLNTVTKYPSIPTFHEIQGKGQLVEENCLLTSGSKEGHFTNKQQIFGFEKIDGTNSRIIQIPGGGYIIGSREELLYAKGDYIENPQMNIVEAVKEFADSLPDSETLKVYFMESYGKGIGKAGKQYTTSGRLGIRLFDICLINADEIMAFDIAKLSAWRESTNSYQKFMGAELIQSYARGLKIDTVPQLFKINGRDLPITLAGMMNFLEKWMPKSKVLLDKDADGSPEGIVIRSSDRSVIAKIRYEDYQRTLSRKRK